MTIEAARETIAALADEDGEVIFAREVRAGCWDHRSDVRAAIAAAAQRGETRSRLAAKPGRAARNAHRQKDATVEGHPQ